MELSRGTAGDQPWADLFAMLASANQPCELVVDTGAQVHRVAFANEAVIGASSPLASDSVLRVALTYGVITSAMLPAIAQQVAQYPGADPIDILAYVAQLSPDTALLLRRRTVAVAATRIFALGHGAYRASDEIGLPVREDTAIDVRAVIYEGVRTHLTDEQLAGAVARYGGRFVLNPDAQADLPQFGFSIDESPVLQALAGGASLYDLSTRFPDVGPRGVPAIVAALVAMHAAGPMPEPVFELARASDQMAAQRTTGQFSTRAPVTGRFAAQRTGNTGVFEVPVVEDLELEPPKRTSGTYELAEEPKRQSGPVEVPKRTSNTFELAEEPRRRTTGSFELAAEDRPTRATGTNPVQRQSGSHVALQADDRPVKRSTVPPARVAPPPSAPPPQAFAQQPSQPSVSFRSGSTGSHAAIPAARPQRPTATPPPEATQTPLERYHKGMKLLANSPAQAAIELKAAAEATKDVDHLAMYAWAVFCAAPDKNAVAKQTKAMLAQAIYKSENPSLSTFYLGRLERMLGRDREALGHFKSVVVLDPRHHEALAEIRLLEARLKNQK